MGGGSSKPTPKPPPPTELVTASDPGEIKCYQHSNFEGTCWTIRDSSRTIEGDDQISSIRVIKGYWVLYENSGFTGRRFFCFERGGPNRDGRYPAPSDGSKWFFRHDCIGSIQPVPPTILQMFVDGDQSYYDVYSSTKSAASNDNYQAARVHGGAWRAYEHGKGSGRYWDLHAKGGQNLSAFYDSKKGDFVNDVISNVEFIGEDYVACYSEPNYKGTCRCYGKNQSVGAFKSLIVGGKSGWLLKSSNSVFHVHPKGGKEGDGHYPNASSWANSNIKNVEIYDPEENQDAIIFYDDPNFGGKATMLKGSWGAGQAITYGSEIVIRDADSSIFLWSKRANFTSGTRQQMVGCSAAEQHLWTVTAGHGKSGSGPVKNGDIFKLVHKPTGCALHSHRGWSSPGNSGQEITCFGGKDYNDNWKIHLEDGAITWNPNVEFYLEHVETGARMRSTGKNFTQNGVTLKEICGSSRQPSKWVCSKVAKRVSSGGVDNVFSSAQVISGSWVAYDNANRTGDFTSLCSDGGEKALNDNIITYGSKLRLKHKLRSKYLTSSETAYAIRDNYFELYCDSAKTEESVWIVCGEYGTNERTGEAVTDGSTICLKNADTGYFVTSRSGKQSPQTSQQMAYGYDRQADYSNLRLELGTNRAWTTGAQFRLIHVETHYSLHSHGVNYSTTLNGKPKSLQEVTFYAGRDGNDYFIGEDMIYQARSVFGNGKYATLPSGMDNKISSVEVLSMPLIELYDEAGFKGNDEKYTSATSYLTLANHNSIVVRSGTWAGFTEVYGGEAYLLDRYGGPAQNGRYLQSNDWGGAPSFKSLMLLTWDYSLIEVYSEPNFGGVMMQYISTHMKIPMGHTVASVRVIRGTFILYSTQDLKGEAFTVSDSDGPRGDGSYAEAEDWGGDAIVIKSIELPDDTFYAAVVSGSKIQLQHLDHGKKFGTYQIIREGTRPVSFYLSNGITDGDEVYLKEGDRYYTWRRTPREDMDSFENAREKPEPWIVKIRDGGMLASNTRFTLSPKGYEDLFLSYDHRDNEILKKLGKDPFEHDFMAANYRADDLDIKLERMVGREKGRTATFFDDGPVLREEVLCEIRASKDFRCYQLVYSYIDGHGVSRFAPSEKRGNTKQDCDQRIKINVMQKDLLIRIYYDSNCIKGIEVGGQTLGDTSGSSRYFRMDDGKQFCGFRGYQTDTQITMLAVQYRMVEGNGWLVRYFKEKGCIGEMYIGVQALNEPPPFKFQSALFTGSFRSSRSISSPKFAIGGWNASSSKILVDNQVVFENKSYKSHNVKVFNGSVHGIEAYIEWDTCDAHTGTFRIENGADHYPIETSDLYPGMTERDVLRSYLLNMPPTNAFGRAFIAVLLEDKDKSPETVAVQKTFANNKKLIQILTANWHDTEKEAKNYLFDNIMGAIDEDLQKETFGKSVVDKKHYVVADDVRLSEVLKSKEYKDLALGYLGVMAYNSDPDRYHMIDKKKIDKDMQKTLSSKWAEEETKRIGDMLRAKFQPQLAFAQVTGEELSHYIDDIGAVIDSPTFRKTFMKMTSADQIEASKAVIAVFTALEPDIEKWEPYLRTMFALVSTSNELNSCQSVIDALEKNEPEFKKAMNESLNALGEEEKGYIVAIAKLYGYTSDAVTKAVDVFLDKTFDLLKNNPSKYLNNKGALNFADDAQAALDAFENQLSKKVKISNTFQKVAAIAGVVAVAFSANFDDPVNSSYFGVSLAEALVNAKDALSSGIGFIDDMLIKASKVMQKVHNKILTPLKNVVAKVGAKIAAKATAISTNFGKLASQLGKYAGKVLGPALGVLASCFSFYYAWQSFESGEIVDGVINVVAGVVGVLAGVLGAINACTGALPGVNVVMGVVSLIVLVGALLWQFVFKPKKRHKLVHELKLKGWATKELEE